MAKKYHTISNDTPIDRGHQLKLNQDSANNIGVTLDERQDVGDSMMITGVDAEESFA